VTKRKKHRKENSFGTHRFLGSPNELRLPGQGRLSWRATNTCQKRIYWPVVRYFRAKGLVEMTFAIISAHGWNRMEISFFLSMARISLPHRRPQRPCKNRNDGKLQNIGYDSL